MIITILKVVLLLGAMVSALTPQSKKTRSSHFGF